MSDNIILLDAHKFDYTTEYLGKALKLENTTILFHNEYAIFEGQFFFDAMNDTVSIGDLIYKKFKTGKIGMFIIYTLQEDDDVPNLAYVKVIHCGYYKNNKPQFFKGFEKSWSSQYFDETEYKESHKKKPETKSEFINKTSFWDFILLPKLDNVAFTVVMTVLLLVIFFMIGIIIQGAIGL